MTPSLKHEATVRRLIRLYHETTELERAQGMTWYASERDWIEALADCYEAERHHVIAAYAALSPRLRVSQNRRALVDLLGGQRRSGVFSRSQEMASAALIHGSRALSGPKVKRFSCNLGGCRVCVTLDIWAARAASYPVSKLGTETGYRQLERAYQAAAKRLGIHPVVLQATLWIHTRGKAN